MTNVTSIQQSMYEHSPAVERPLGLLTMLARAVVGGFFGSFVLLIARILFVYTPSNGWFMLFLPFLLVFGLATGVPAGLLIWAGTKVTRGPLHTINRCVIGVLVLSLGWFLLWLFWLGQDTSPELQLWALPVILVPGVLIGLITGSRLRPGRELIRGGEANSTVLKILAGLTGSVLRVVVVFLFLATVIAVVCLFQEYFLGSSPPPEYLRKGLFWYTLAFGHFAAGLVVLFARIRFWLLARLTLIATTPVIASLFVPEMIAPVRYVIIGYLGMWAMFLLTRWRQTDVALSALKKEVRYYLID